MKIPIAIRSGAALFSLWLLAGFKTQAGVVAGPIVNPANGHEYYLLSPNNWTASEAEAEQLGGTLAIIRNVSEQEWVFSTFGNYGRTNRNLWIGLHRQSQGGPMVWVMDRKLDYTNWAVGQPDNAGSENFVHMFANSNGRVPGTWNDLADTDSIDGAVNCGVVEVPGKSMEQSLNENEKALIGTWYANGDGDHPCWITGTENMLFEIYDGRACRLIYTTEGLLFIPISQHAISGEIVEDKILWSNNTWWSRKPAEYRTAGKAGGGKVRVVEIEN